jgi:GTP-binding protein
LSPAAADDPLVIRALEFCGGVVDPDGWRPEATLPEVAFGGRSNVGKSSLLNRLVRRKAFARVSQTPGKTREINFFRVNEAFYLVDLPGYGYARVSKAMRDRWREIIERYLRRSPMLRGMVQLVDARHPPTPDDLQMLDFLSEIELPTLVVLTKIDKLRPRERAERLAEASRLLQLEPEQIIPFSAVSGEGRDELAGAIVDLVQQPPRSSE